MARQELKRVRDPTHFRKHAMWPTSTESKGSNGPGQGVDEAPEINQGKQREIRALPTSTKSVGDLGPNTSRTEGDKNNKLPVTP